MSTPGEGHLKMGWLDAYGGGEHGVEAGKDYGADPMGDGTFRMAPSGDIVDFAESNRSPGR
jgi:hypothetical protein